MLAWKQLLVIQTINYLIVPGVSMRGEALAVLCENFDFIGTGNFMECYCRYAYPSEPENLSVSQTIKQCRITERMWRVYSSVAIVHDIAKNVSVSPCVELVKAILLHSQGEYFTFDEEELGFLSGE